MSRGAALGALLALAGALVMAPGAAGRSFELGLTDPLFASPDGAKRDLWLDRAVASRAGMVLPLAAWSGIAPTARAGFEPADPGDPAYRWDQLDDAVRDAEERGLSVTILVSSAPSWAEGPNRPAGAHEGTWRPEPGELRRFGVAIATRYAGGYSDPDDPGAPLPRVTHFQLWAEPNLAVHLTPQWRRGEPVAPNHYRRMLRAFYAGVHSVSNRNEVVSGGTAPYGDLGRRGERMPPVTFWRELLCLKGADLQGRRCPRPAKFDVWAHHPINVGRPRRSARNPRDVSTPDIGKLRRIVEEAVRTGRALPRSRKPFWATEIWWDSSPPDPRGVPIRKHARYLAESFYLLWKQRAQRVVWFLAQDQPARPDFSVTRQCGLYRTDGRPKPAQQAFRFPFVADPVARRRIRVWGIAPAGGRVAIQRRAGKRWRTIAHERTGDSLVFTGYVRAGRGSLLRARSDSEASVPFRAS